MITYWLGWIYGVKYPCGRHTRYCCFEWYFGYWDRRRRVWALFLGHHCERSFGLEGLGAITVLENGATPNEVSLFVYIGFKVLSQHDIKMDCRRY
jgi:hypothetical protein